MHTYGRIASGRGLAAALPRYWAGVIALVCGLAGLSCTSDPSGTIVLPAQQGIPDRSPAAAAIHVNVFNDSNYPASTTVDCFIGNTLVHHTEAVLTSASASDLDTRMLLGQEEADRVVITARIDDASGAALWSDQKTYQMGTDFVEAGSVSYAIVYPAGSAQPVAIVQAPPITTSGRAVTLDGSYSHDPNGKSLTYMWEMVSGPAVTLGGTNLATASFTAPTVTAATDAVFRLTVSNGRSSSSNEVVVTVQPNQAPVAVIAAVGSQVPGSAVTLDGSGSYDPDNDPITYAWAQVAGTPVSLSGAAQAVATFTAPAGSGTLTFELRVADQGLSAIQQVVVTVAPINHRPVAAASGPSGVMVNDTVSLSGSGSQDPDGDPLTYQWVQIGGASMSLVNTNQAVAAFIVPSTLLTPATLTFRLTVSDGLLSDFADVSIAVAAAPRTNHAPVAVAYGSGSASPSGMISLDGTYSFDADGDPLTYTWTQVAGPNILSPVNQKVVSVAVPSDMVPPQVLTFRLTVSDGQSSAYDETSVNVVSSNQSPSVSVVLPGVVKRGDTVLLDASGSSDPDADPLTFLWEQVGGAGPTAVTLQNANTSVASFPVDVTMPTGQGLEFRLTVSDGRDSVVTSVYAIVGPLAVPVAVPPMAQMDDVVTLDGTSSLGTGLTYHWTQTGGMGVGLAPNANQAVVTFVMPSAAGTMRFDLTVDDGVSTNTVSVSVAELPPGPVAPAPLSKPFAISHAVAGEAVTLYGSGSYDVEGGPLTYQWQQTGGPAVALAVSNQPDVSFTAPNVAVETMVSFDLMVMTSKAATDVRPVSVVIEPASYTGTLPPWFSYVGVNASEVYEGQIVAVSAVAVGTFPSVPRIAFGQIYGVDVSYLGTTTYRPGPGSSNLIRMFNAPTVLSRYTNVLKLLVSADTIAGGLDMRPVTVTVRLMGDVDGDGYVTVGDQTAVQNAMGTVPGDAAYNAWADLNGDGVIDNADENLVIANLGRQLIPVIP